MVKCGWSPVVQTATGLFQLSVCLLFTIIGYAAPNWADYSVGSFDINFGLWETCTNDNCASVPDSFETSKTKAARAFGILGMLTAVGAIVPAVIYLLKRNKLMLMVAASVSMVTFLLVMIEFIVAVEQVKDTTTDYGYCFGLTLTAFLQAFFGGVSFFGAYHRARCQDGA